LTRHRNHKTFFQKVKIKNVKNIKLLFSLLIAAFVAFLLNKTGAEHGAETFALLLMPTPDSKRGYLAVFMEYLKTQYGHANITEMDLKPVNLRLMTDLKIGTTTYTFNLRQKYTGDTASLKEPGAEIIMDENKVYFFPLMRVATRKNHTANKVLGPVFTYEDKAHHDDATGVGEVESLHALYNGNISIKSGANTRVDKWLNDSFRVVPAQQKEEASDVLTFWPQYGPSDEERGYVAMPPTLILESKDTNEAIINTVGPTTGIEGATNKKNILQLDLIGWVYNPGGSGQGLCG
jgi:hypothetical protein